MYALRIAEIFACAVSFLEEMQSHLSPFGIFQTLLQGDLSVTGPFPHRLRHLTSSNTNLRLTDFLGYKQEVTKW